MFTVTRESVAKYNQMRDTLCRKAISREEVKQHLAELSMPSSSIVISIFIKHNLIRLKNNKYCFSMNETNVPELSSVLGELKVMLIIRNIQTKRILVLDKGFLLVLFQIISRTIHLKTMMRFVKP